MRHGLLLFLLGLIEDNCERTIFAQIGKNLSNFVLFVFFLRHFKQQLYRAVVNCCHSYMQNWRTVLSHKKSSKRNKKWTHFHTWANAKILRNFHGSSFRLRLLKHLDTHKLIWYVSFPHFNIIITIKTCCSIADKNRQTH